MARTADGLSPASRVQRKVLKAFEGVEDGKLSIAAIGFRAMLTTRSVKIAVRMLHKGGFLYPVDADFSRAVIWGRVQRKEVAA